MNEYILLEGGEHGGGKPRHYLYTFPLRPLLRTFRTSQTIEHKATREQQDDDFRQPCKDRLRGITDSTVCRVGAGAWHTGKAVYLRGHELYLGRTVEQANGEDAGNGIHAERRSNGKRCVAL